MREVTLEEIMSAREERAYLQKSILEKFHSTLISFTMNIPGPVKDSPLIRRTFDLGCKKLDSCLESEKISVLHREEKCQWTGCELLLAVDEDPIKIKKLCTAIEDEDAIGRLFDMDVIDKDGNKLDREMVNGGQRNCIVCGKSGRGCASRRVHDAKELHQAANRIMKEYFAMADQKTICHLVSKSLTEEVFTTPKPGLVDASNNGSHDDMDIYTFIDSIEALETYWGRFMKIGQETFDKEAAETFFLLREEGKKAEAAMFQATYGVNTHKGAIFTLGILCGAIGRLWRADQPYAGTQQVLQECAKIGEIAVKEDLEKKKSKKEFVKETTGMKLYQEYGMKGVRGEVAEGLPHVKNRSLPLFKEQLKKGYSFNDAGLSALYDLIFMVEDTNMVARGGRKKAEVAQYMCILVLDDVDNGVPLSMKTLKGIDKWFISYNLSPGGCADLLSVTYFLYALENQIW